MLVILHSSISFYHPLYRITSHRFIEFSYLHEEITNRRLTVDLNYKPSGRIEFFHYNTLPSSRDIHAHECSLDSFMLYIAWPRREPCQTSLLISPALDSNPDTAPDFDSGPVLDYNRALNLDPYSGSTLN
ncbi:hypothetical protein EVAR_63154_1 [Eumeta japonica]|uniref:Uncharacterized protein n=1 Tax=Eumeta variegata TaxID=151549 RepID=A0A4C1ZXM8_EUMVA|nr:hypothetical protein EVAR_63154_1 [Eumeta japonica]